MTAILGILALVAKSAAIASVAIVAAALCRKKEPALRHAIWLCSVLLVLALPLLQLALPGVPVLVARIAAPPPAEIQRVAPTNAPPLELRSLRVQTAEPQPVEAVPPPAAAPPTAPAPSLAMTGLTIWLTGVFILGAQSLWGFLYIRRIAKKSRRTILDPAWIAAVADRASYTRPWDVRIGRKDCPIAAMTWGVRHPVILLPESAEAWPEELLEAVLLHEFAHARRCDSLSQLAGVVACIGYWFNPLVWLAASKLRLEAELAADEAVLAAGLRPSAYAEILVGLSALFSGRGLPSTPVGVSIMKKKNIESRIHAILAPRARRKGATSLHALIAIAAGAAVVLPIALLTPVTGSVSAPQHHTNAQTHSRRARRAVRRLHRYPVSNTRSIERAIEADSARLARDQERLSRAIRRETNVGVSKRLHTEISQELARRAAEMDSMNVERRLELKEAEQERKKALDEAREEIKRAEVEAKAGQDEARHASDEARKDIEESMKAQSAERRTQLDKVRDEVERAKKQADEAVRAGGEERRAQLDKVRDEVERANKQVDEAIRAGSDERRAQLDKVRDEVEQARKQADEATRSLNVRKTVEEELAKAGAERKEALDQARKELDELNAREGSQRLRRRSDTAESLRKLREESRIKMRRDRAAISGRVKRLLEEREKAARERQRKRSGGNGGDDSGSDSGGM